MHLILLMFVGRNLNRIIVFVSLDTHVQRVDMSVSVSSSVH